jgi:1-phosphatidylinositol-4-phosphate 5-kinase
LEILPHQQQAIHHTGSIYNYYIYTKIKQKFSSDLNIIESEEEPGVFYHMAVIDYLQEWTHQKKTEKVIKNVINVKIDQ